jgi:hypothetical protein
MEPSISAEVTVDEIARFTGLPANQIRARSKDAIADKFAESSGRGTFRAMPHKIEGFLDRIQEPSPENTTAVD